jgi:hypothetical protein
MAESGVADVPQENAPTEAAVAAIWESPPQPVSAWSKVEEPSALLWKSCSCGSGNTPERPNAASAGPESGLWGKGKMVVRSAIAALLQIQICVMLKPVPPPLPGFENGGEMTRFLTGIGKKSFRNFIQ